MPLNGMQPFPKQTSAFLPCGRSVLLLWLPTPSRILSAPSRTLSVQSRSAQTITRVHNFREFELPKQKCNTGMVLLPLAVFTMNLIAPSSVEAGILSGMSGFESFELPRLPKSDVFKNITEANRKRYEDLDAKFKASPFLEELLKRSKENAQKNKKEIQDKYCERGAEWGVGDCSLAAASKEEKEAFLKALRKRNVES